MKCIKIVPNLRLRFGTYKEILNLVHPNKNYHSKENIIRTTRDFFDKRFNLVSKIETIERGDTM